MKKVISVEEKRLKSDKKGEYVLYRYTLSDGDTIISTNRIETGARVETWFDDKWQMARIRAYKPKR